jgi:hypothetical protein
MKGLTSTALAFLLVLSLVAASAAFLLRLRTDCALAEWSGPLFWRQAADSTNDTGKWTSSAFDGEGRPGIAYYDATSSTLKFAHWNGASWEKQVVDDSVGLWDAADRIYSSLAFDHNDSPAIAYYAEGAGSARLNYARWNGDSWDVETVDSRVGAALGLFPSLGYDSSGNPAISYYDPVQGLKYACRSGDAWSIAVVDSGSQTGEYTSLAFDNIGGRGIAYYQRGTGSLKYAWWNGSSWSISTVEQGSDLGRYASLAYDPNGNPQIAYYDGSNTAVKHAWHDGSWHTTWLDGIGSGEDVGEYSNMVTHNDGGLTIVYYDDTNTKGKIAHKETGGTWDFYDLDPESPTGRFCSAAVAPNDTFGVSYYHEAASEGKLKYLFVDNVAPSVAISNIADFVNSTSSIGGSASDDVALSSVKLWIKDSTANQYWSGASWQGGETWIDPTSHTAAWDTWTYDSSGVSFTSGNTYTVGAQATDALARTSTVPTDAFVFDTTCPTVTADDIDGFVASLESISGSAADTAPGQLLKVQVRIESVDSGEYWDGASWQATTTWVDASGTGSWSYDASSVSWADGYYRVTARAIDKAGNSSVEIADIFVYDTEAPAVTLDDIPDFLNTLDSLSGTASDVFAVDKVQVQIRSTDNDEYWSGSGWQAGEAWIDAAGTSSWSYDTAGVGWTDGAYGVTARALDRAGNISTEVSDAFVYDSTDPTVTIDDIDDFLDSLTSTAGTAADAVGLDRVEVQLAKQAGTTYWNGTDWQAAAAWVTAAGTNSWTYSLPALEDETYTVRARSIDKAGNVSAEASDSFVYDTTPPTVTLDGIAEFVNSAPAVGGTAADDPPGEIETVQVQIENASGGTYWDGSAWAGSAAWLEATGTASWTYAPPSLSEADYVIRARSVDKTGHVSTEAVASFAYDTTSPEVTICSVPAFANVAPTVTGTAVDSYTGVEQVRVLFRQNDDNRFWDGDSWEDGETWLTCTGTDYWGYGSSSVGWSDGCNYTVTVKSIDRAGNESGNIWRSFIYDSTNPSVALDNIPNFVDTLASVGGTAADTAPGELEKVQIRISNTRTEDYWDGTSWQETATWLDATGTTPWSYDTSSMSWPDSYYSVTARAVDRAGNESTEAANSFGYDATDPTVTLGGIADFVNAPPTIGGTAADVIGVNRIRVQVVEEGGGTYWDGTGWQATAAWVDAAGTTSWTYAMPSLTSGSTYTVKAKSVDDSGRESSEVSDSFVFDSTKPTATLAEIPDIVNSLPSISGTAADSAPGELEKVQIQIQRGAGTAYWNGSDWQGSAAWMDATGTASWTYAMPALEDEDYVVRARSTDKAGNVSGEDLDSFTYDATPASASLNGIDDFLRTLTSLEGTAQDNKSGVASVSILIRDDDDGTHWDGDSWVSGATWLACSGTASWSCDTGDVSWADGHRYIVTARATDKAGNTSAPDARPSDSFHCDTTGPTVALSDIADLVSPLSSVGGTAEDTGPGQLEKVQVQIGQGAQSTYWNGSGWQESATWMDATGTTSWTYAMPALTDESYTVWARSIDRAGNMSSQVSDSFLCDATSPTVTLNDIESFGNSLASVGGTAADTAPGELERVQVQIEKRINTTYWNGSDWQESPAWVDATGTASWTYAVPALEDENYGIKARSVDKVGNRSIEASDVFVLDTTAPVGFGPVKPRDAATGISLRPMLASSVATDATPRTVLVLEETYEYYRFQIATDAGFGKELQESQWQAAESWSPPSLLAESTGYYWRVKVKDDLGNESDWSSACQFTTVATTKVSADSGGDVQGLDGAVNISLPAGAVSGDVRMYVLPVDGSPASIPSGFALGGTFFEIEAFSADGAPVNVLDCATDITVQYTDDDVAAAEGQTDRLMLAYWDGAAGVWHVLATEIDTGNKTATATTTHLCTWAMLVGSPLARGIALWARAVIIIDAIIVISLCGFVVWRRLMATHRSPQPEVVSDDLEQDDIESTWEGLPPDEE